MPKCAFPTAPEAGQRWKCPDCNVTYIYDAKSGEWVWVPF